MSRLSRLRHQHQSGQALVEFALVGTLLLIMLLGMIDGARIYAASLAMESAASEGAAYASIRPDNIAEAESRAAAEGAGSLMIDPAGIEASVTPPPVIASGAMITCTVSYTFEPVVGMFFNQDLTITKTATAPIMQ